MKRRETLDQVVNLALDVGDIGHNFTTPAVKPGVIAPSGSTGSVTPPAREHGQITPVRFAPPNSTAPDIFNGGRDDGQTGDGAAHKTIVTTMSGGSGGAMYAEDEAPGRGCCSGGAAFEDCGAQGPHNLLR